MKVKELIEKLQQHNADMEVYIQQGGGIEFDYMRAESVRETFIILQEDLSYDEDEKETLTVVIDYE